MILMIILKVITQLNNVFYRHCHMLRKMDEYHFFSQKSYHLFQIQNISYLTN